MRHRIVRILTCLTPPWIPHLICVVMRSRVNLIKILMCCHQVRTSCLFGVCPHCAQKTPSSKPQRQKVTTNHWSPQSDKNASILPQRRRTDTRMVHAGCVMRCVFPCPQKIRICHQTAQVRGLCRYAALDACSVHYASLKIHFGDRRKRLQHTNTPL